MYACTAYGHVCTVGYIGGEWRDMIDQGDMALYCMYGISIACIRIRRYVKPANIRPGSDLVMRPDMVFLARAVRVFPDVVL
jgi:hypothetical protein